MPKFSIPSELRFIVGSLGTPKKLSQVDSFVWPSPLKHAVPNKSPPHSSGCLQFSPSHLKEAYEADMNHNFWPP